MKHSAFSLFVGMFLSCASTLLAQNAQFFRIMAPEPSSAPADILDISPDGMLTWSNSATDVVGFIQSSTEINGDGH